MQPTIQTIPDDPQAIEAAIFDAIVREMWLHYGRNGALDWHGFEPSLSGTGSLARLFRTASGPTNAMAGPGEPEVSRIDLTFVSQLVDALGHTPH